MSPQSTLILATITLLCLAALACGRAEEDSPREDASPDASQTAPPDMSADSAIDAATDLSPAADQEPGAGDGAASEDLTDSDLEILPEEDPCDALIPEQCVMPWPSSHFLASDPTRVTGYTLRFGEESLPRSRAGARIDPAPFTRMDGYGLGVQGHFFFKDLDDSDFATEETLERSISDDSPSLWLEVAPDGTLTRVPHWVEQDRVPPAQRDRAHFIRPAVILKPNTRYIIALRGLQTLDGTIIPASEAFEKLRSGLAARDPKLATRQARFDDLFALLQTHGVSKDSLTLAWDFHTASQEALTGPMLHMRDDALSSYTQGAGPALTIHTTTEFAPAPDDSAREVNPRIGLQLEGTMLVPLYLKSAAADDQAVFAREDASSLPARNGTRQANIFIRIPHNALEGSVQGVIVYGHGLLGTRYETYAQHIELLAQRYNFIIVSADLIGMAAEDAGAAEATAFDLNAFPRMADRLHQGVLEYLLLTRAAKTTLPLLDALTSRQITIDPDDVHYFGGSQGGIFGATYMALSTDVQRGFLAVPGNNYAMMLQRSVNFRQFQQVLDLSYSRSLDAPVLISLLQLLWDGTDPISYLRHIRAEPLPNTPPHDILLMASKGDYQVAVVTNEIAARSDIELPIIGPYDITRTPWGVPTAPYPHSGSGLILWDFGNPWPTNLANTPPNDGLRDPHSRQAEVDAIGEVFETFLRRNIIIDICNNSPCQFP